MYFPAPSADVLAHSSLSDAARAYQEEAVVDHPIWGECRPRFAPAASYIKKLRRGQDTKLEVNRTFAETLAQVEEKKRAQERRYDLFRQYCEEMGINDGEEPGFGSCDSCHQKRAGVMYYQPNAMGIPTPVLFLCDRHSLER